MGIVIDIDKDDYDALLIDRVRALDFVRTVLTTMDEGGADGGIVTFSDRTILTALRAIYPDAYEAEMQRRHAVRTEGEG